MAKMQLPDSEVERIVGLIDSATNGAYAALKESYTRRDLSAQLMANDQIIRIAELRARTLNTFYPPPREENGSEDA